MKRSFFQFQIPVFVLLILIFVTTKIYSQDKAETTFGFHFGGFSNFPMEKDFIKKYKSSIFLSPYIRIGKNEISGGLLYPVESKALYKPDLKASPRPGFIVNYRYFVLNPDYRENLYIHYSFEYIRFKLNYLDNDSPGSNIMISQTETDMYINNVIGLGYNLFFDTNGKFALFYSLDYLISRESYKLSYSRNGTSSWQSNLFWNRLSTQIGISIKLL